MNYKWSIFVADLDPVKGSEQRGERPVLVVSDESFNTIMPVVTVLPLTSRKAGRKIYPNEVLLKKSTAGLAQESIVLAHQIRTLSKERLKNLVGTIASDKTREAVHEALKIHLNL